MQAHCAPPDFENIIHLLSPCFDLDYQVFAAITEYERNHEDKKFLYTSKDTYKAAFQAMHTLGDLITAYHNERKREDLDEDFRQDAAFPVIAGDEIDRIIRAHRTVIENLWQTLAAAVEQIAFEDIQYISTPPSRILAIDNERWTQVDIIDLGSQVSIDSHNFTLINTSHTATSHEVFLYPDGTPVHDTVKRWVEGGMRFQLRNVIKGKKTLIIRRTDVHNGGYQTDILLEGAKPHILDVSDMDSRHRWRNLFVLFEEGEVSGDAVVTFNIRDKGRDNSGMIWVYQVL
jgi:hypothetical protein